MSDLSVNLLKARNELSGKRTTINDLIAKKLTLKYHMEIQYRIEETVNGAGNVNIVVAKNADDTLAEDVAADDVARGQALANQAAAGGGGEPKEPYKSRGTAKGIKIQLIKLSAIIRQHQAEFDAIQTRIDALLDAQPLSPEAVAFTTAAAAGAAAGEAATAAAGGLVGSIRNGR